MGDWGLLLTPQPTLRVQTDVECIAGNGLKWQHTAKLLLAPLLHPRAESWVKNVGEGEMEQDPERRDFSEILSSRSRFYRG